MKAYILLTDTGELMSGLDNIDADSDMDKVADLMDIFRRHRNQIAADLAALKQEGE